MTSPAKLRAKSTNQQELTLLAYNSERATKPTYGYFQTKPSLRKILKNYQQKLPPIEDYKNIVKIKLINIFQECQPFRLNKKKIII